MDVALGLAGLVGGVLLIVWGAETFAEHLATASARLGVTTFALALLLAGAEPEELATAVAASVRHVPGIALGDVVGANVAMCCVALGVGALVAPLPFGARVRRYALLGLPVGAAAVVIAWDGSVTRPEGAVLVVLYVAYVGLIWLRERRPPALGETGEIEEASLTFGAGTAQSSRRGRVGRELGLVVAGVVAMAAGATVLVVAVERLVSSERGQTDLGLTVVGFATAFELVVLAWSAARRGATEAVVAAVVGSFAYNVTMTLGVAAVVRPLTITDAALLHAPFVVMLASLAVVLLAAWRAQRLSRRAGLALLALYPVLVLAVALR